MKRKCSRLQEKLLFCLDKLIVNHEKAANRIHHFPLTHTHTHTSIQAAQETKINQDEQSPPERADTRWRWHTHTGAINLFRFVACFNYYNQPPIIAPHVCSCSCQEQAETFSSVRRETNTISLSLPSVV